MTIISAANGSTPSRPAEGCPAWCVEHGETEDQSVFHTSRRSVVPTGNARPVALGIDRFDRDPEAGQIGEPVVCLDGQPLNIDQARELATAVAVLAELATDPGSDEAVKRYRMVRRWYCPDYCDLDHTIPAINGDPTDRSITHTCRVGAVYPAGSKANVVAYVDRTDPDPDAGSFGDPVITVEVADDSPAVTMTPTEARDAARVLALAADRADGTEATGGVRGELARLLAQVSAVLTDDQRDRQLALENVERILRDLLVAGRIPA